MDKCYINNIKTLDDVFEIIKPVFNSKAGELIENLKEEIQKIVTNVQSPDLKTSLSLVLSDMILNIAEQYGFDEDFPLFFNSDNLKSFITTRKSGEIYQKNNNVEELVTGFDEVQTRKEANLNFLTTAYGSAINARNYAILDVRKHLVDALFLGTGHLGNANIGTVLTTAKLNENIRLYLQKMLDEIVDYLLQDESLSLEEIDFLKSRPTIYKYNRNKKIIKNKKTGLDLVMEIADRYLKPYDNITASMLSNYYNDRNTNPKYKRKLRAYNARTFLKNFDNYLYMTYGKIIDIDGIFGDFNGLDKYRIADKHSATVLNFRVAEPDVQKETSRIVRELIENIPVFRYGTLEEVGNKNLTFQEFTSIVGKIKNLILRPEVRTLKFDWTYINDVNTDKGIRAEIWNSLSKETQDFLKDKTLAKAIACLKIEDGEAFTSVLELLLNEKFREYYGGGFLDTSVLNDNEVDLIWSMYKGIYERNSKINSKIRSINSVSKSTDKISYFNYINLVVNSIFSNSFLQLHLDFDGNMKIRFLTDADVENTRRDMVTKIDASFSEFSPNAIQNYHDNIELYYNIKNNDGTIKFLIPINENDFIDASVVLNTQKVVLTHNENVVSVQELTTLFELPNSNLLAFTDYFTKFDYTNNSDLLKTSKAYVKDNFYNKLLEFTSRIVANQYVSVTMLNRDKGKVSQSSLNKIFGQNNTHFKYDSSTGLIPVTSYLDKTFLRTLALARLTSEGKNTATQVKDSEGNTQSLNTFSRLISSIPQLWEILEKEEPIQILSEGKLVPATENKYGKAKFMGSASRHFVLLLNPNLFKGIALFHEFYSPKSQKTKKAKDFTKAELIYANFILMFASSLYDDPNDNFKFLSPSYGNTGFYANVTSDKPLLSYLLVDINQELPIEWDENGNVTDSKPYVDFTPEEHKKLIAHEFGIFYKNCFEKIENDYLTVNNFINMEIVPNSEWSENIKNRFLSFPGFNYASDFKEYRNWYELNSIDSEFKLLFPEETILLKMAVKKYNYQYPINPIELIDLIHLKGRKLYRSNTLISQIYMFDPDFLRLRGINLSKFNEKRERQYYNIDEFWEVLAAETIRSIVNSNFDLSFFNASNDIQLFRDYLNKLYAERELKKDKNGNPIVDKNGDPVYIYKKNPWISADKKLVVANLYVTYRNPNTNKIDEYQYRITDLASIAALKKPDINTILNNIDAPFKEDPTIKAYRLELNPVLEKFMYMSYLITLENQNAGVGSFIGLPNKSKSVDSIKQEGSLFIGQEKRNVKWSALVNLISTDMLNGPARRAKMATVEDVDGKGTVLSGKNRSINVYGGMTLVDPFMNYLENGGLMSAAVGNVKKNFCTFKHTETGVGGVIKTANFPLTNDLIRQEPLRQNILWKMSHIPYTDEYGNQIDVDITHDYFGHQISYGLDSTDSSKNNIFFKTKSGDIYRVLPFEKRTDLGSNMYMRKVVQVNPEDRSDTDNITYMNLDNEITSDAVKINNNYDLWRAFGGAWSMEIANSSRIRKGKETIFKGSENSIKFVVDAMNKVGYIREPYKNMDLENYRNLSQKQIFQTLKHSDILWLMTLDSIKEGAANINPVETYNNKEELDFQIVDISINEGPQLDKEHSAQDSSVSLATQIIAAAAQTPYTYLNAQKIYQGLQSITDIGLLKLFNPLNKYLTDKQEEALNEFKQNALDVIITSLAKPNSDSFAEQLAYDIKNSVVDGLNKYKDTVFPISDNVLFNKSLSTFASYISKAGIKIKIQGNLAVLNPSEGFVKLYDGKSYDLFDDPNAELEELQKKHDDNPIFDKETSSHYDLSKMEFGRTYKVIYTDDIRPRDFVISYDNNFTDSVVSIDGNNAKINLATINLLFNQQAWKQAGIGYDFKNVGEFTKFLVTRESLKSDLIQYKGEEDLNYEVRLNNATLNYLTGVQLDTRPNINSELLLNEIKNTHPQRIDETDKEYLERIKLEFNKESNRLTNPNEGVLEYVKLDYDSYQELKSLAKLGKIKRIVEYIKVGRDLDPYNVRFLGEIDEEIGSFNLWDLDSVGNKFRVIDLMENGSEQLINDFLLAFAQKEGKEIQTIEEAYKYYSKEVQKDIAELSNNVVNKLEEFNNILADPDEDRREQLINLFVQQRLTEKEKLQYNNLKELNWIVDGESIDRINFIKNLDSVQGIIYIDNKPVKVDKNSIQIQAYELVMPKLWTKEFGFDEDTSLEEVQSDPNWFTKRFLQKRNDKKSLDYDVVLENINGEHTYILNKNNLPKDENGKDRLQKLEVRVVRDLVDNKWYRQNSNEDNMYEVPEGTTFYTDGNVEIMVLRDTKSDPFIKNVEKCLNSFSYSSINFGGKVLNGGLENLKLIDVLSKYDGHVKNLFKEISEILNNESFTDKLKVELSENFLKTFKLNITKKLTIDDLPPNHPFRKLGAKRHAAFLKSLDVVATRIPAQSMLSFMAMKVVKFENPDINNAYVNSLLLFLQGSDLDIDSVTLNTYNINNKGLLETWSPYSNVNDVNLLTESMKIPLPTGKSIFTKGKVTTILNTRKMSLTEAENFYDLFKNLFKFVNNNGNLELRIDNSSIENLRLIQKLVTTEALPEVDNLDIDGLEFHLQELTLTNVKNIITLVNNAIAKAIDKHNSYLQDVNSISYDKLFRIINNYILYNLYDTIIDPANQLVAQESVDGYTTKFIKSISENSTTAKKVAEDNSRRGPGSALGLIESLRDTQEGKDCIANSASGIKAFFTGFYASSKILNSGDSDAQASLIRRLGRGRFLFLLANIQARDLSTIKNKEVLDCLLAINSDLDAILFLSSLLGLSADNAKELVLSKINAGTNIIGLYLYGIASGIDFLSLSKTLMSRAGRTLLQVYEGNIFKDEPKYYDITSAFRYFTKLGFEEVYKACSKGEEHYNNFIESIPEEYKDFWAKIEDPKVYDTDLLKIIHNEKFKQDAEGKYINLDGSYATFLNTLENYIVNYKKATYKNPEYKGPSDLQVLKHLAYGAANMRKLGEFILNKEIEGTLLKSLKINLDLEFLILDTINTFKQYHNNRIPKDVKPDIEEDSKRIIDLDRLFTDEGYLDETIKILDKYSHSINVLRVLSNIEHLWGYLKANMMYDKALKELSYRYRSIRDLETRKLKKLYSSIKMDKILHKMSNLVQLVMISEWLTATNKSFILPAGNTYFDPNTNLEVEKALEEPRVIRLGTDAGNNTFRMWMEREVIPNLKMGKNVSGNSADVSNNVFIKRLNKITKNNVGLRNTMLLYSLENVNLMPKAGSVAEVELNLYIEAFEELGKYNYTEGKTDPKDPFLNLKNLFTLYTMIAFEWKPGLNSLFKVVNNNTTVKGNNDFRQEYFSFILLQDNSSKKLFDNTKLEIVKFLAEKDDPITSNNPYIIQKDSTEGNILAKRKLKEKKLKSSEYDDYGLDMDELRLEIENDYDQDDEYAPRKKKTKSNYIPESSKLNKNYNPYGVEKNLTKEIREDYKFRITDSNGKQKYMSGELIVTYEGKESIKFNGKEYDIKQDLGFDFIPFDTKYKKNGTDLERLPVVDTDLIIKAIKQHEQDLIKNCN